MARGRLGAAVNDFRRLWHAGTVSGMSDAQLLAQFAANRDEAAFDSLMARHGPLVWSVCKSILTDPHDVEDAFQASFLILVRKAQSLRVDDSLCGWLYRVSYRVAQEARSHRDLRRRREQAAAERTPIAADADRACDELLCILNHEINRLPEKYRLPIVLCELEGLTRKEAAGQLDWPPGTVATRLARGQDLLRQRMRRRLGDNAVELSSCLGGLVSTSVPAACREATARAALAVAIKGWTAAGPTASALVLARRVHRAMVWTGLRYVFLLAMGLAAVTWVSLGGIRIQTNQPPRGAEASRPPVLPPASANYAEQEQPAHVSSPQIGDRLTFAGKVLDPEGKPQGGASVYLDLSSSKFPLHRLGITGVDGRFRATVLRREITRAEAVDPWRFAKIVATAPGFGPVWEHAPVPARPDSTPADDLTLRLAPDDVPIDGRIVSAAGQPVVAARVVASRLSYRQAADGKPVPLDRPESGGGGFEVRVGSLVTEATTDSDGRFRMTGLGRDRLVALRVIGRDVAEQEIRVATQKGQPAPAVAPGNTADSRQTTSPIYGASFVHVAEPGRSIEGVVRERDTGKPIAGALVNTLTTDQEGRFRIDGLTREFECALDIRGPAGQPYLCRRLTVVSHGTGLHPVTAIVELSRGVQIRGRLTDSATGKPILGRVSYAPLRDNAYSPGFMEQVATSEDIDDSGRFALTGLPGRGVVLVTAREHGGACYPMLSGVTPEDRRRGIALADDELAVDALPRPLSLVGSHAYKVIDIPQGRRDFETNFELALHRGRTVNVRVVDLKGEPLRSVMAFGLRHPTAKVGHTGRGDESFAVHDLDVASPRRVFFYQPDRDLGAFVDLAGNEPADVTARLAPCGSIVGRVVQRASTPLADAHFGLVYDDAHGVAHIAFPSGRWVPSAVEAVRDRRTGEDIVPVSPINLEQTSDKDGRFQIRHVIPGARYHFQVVIDNPRRRLGLKAPVQTSKKLVHEHAIVPGQVLDVGEVRIVPEELRGRRSPR
jgi:RNA polymerase sigma factor (sigma-70 family)